MRVDVLTSAPGGSPAQHRYGDLASALSAARRSGGLVWIELDHPKAQDFDGLTAPLGLHHLAVEDAVHARDRPKLDTYDDRRFLSLVTLRHQGDDWHLRVGRVMVFIGPGFVVTVRHEDGETVERARARVLANPTAPEPLDVLHAVVDVAVDELLDVAAKVEASILASGDRLFSPTPPDEAKTLYQVTRQLLELDHAVQPLLEPLRHLVEDATAEGSDEAARHFRDVHDHATVLDRDIRELTALVDHLRSSNDSRIALQQNTDMRRIASWAAVIAVPTAITGFFGMNVPYPGFEAVSGLVAAVILQITLGVTLVLIFRRKGWL
jgi:magnesium transporter